jgi:molybdopterin-guanine dinucleotide biosynthesis protein A
VAALAAGLVQVSAARVLLLAADLPFLGAELVRTLVREAGRADGAVLTDAEGRDQWLAACYQRAALDSRLDRLRAGRGTLEGSSLRALVSGLDLRRVADPAGLGFDCDTWEDVRHVRRLVEDGGRDLRPTRAESES